MSETNFSVREKDLLRGSVKPQSNEEYDFIQENANAVIDEKPSPTDTLPEPPPDPPAGPVTYADRVAKADDAKRDGG